ncbi:S8 family peptidase [Paenibacillus lutrae]|uniref:S8 family serine peptidase n=1 Tax=Paenibacillus lutrae TaxID=2078573 RepID=A0A7X3JYQ8_9BACL|nr:S8 family peptidase [Paenibacillus lutrae]MVO99408.1 S8 family serine peptidase [Paenibacillus lutrae]
MRRQKVALHHIAMTGLILLSACSSGREARRMEPEAELRSKQALVAQDMATTGDLCRNQCLIHVNRLHASLQDQDAGRIKDKLRQMQQTHEHMIRLIWTPAASSGRSEIITGKLTKEIEQAAAPYLEEARKSAASSKTYFSPNFVINETPYFVTSVPSSDKKSAVTAIVKQTIVQQVSNHQLKNLRLKPFNNEQKTGWKIKTVDSETLQPRRVTHPEEHEGTSHYERHDVVVQFHRALNDSDLSRIRLDTGATKIKQIGDTYIITARSLEARQLMDYFRKRTDVRFVEPHYIYESNDLSRGTKPLGWFFDWWPGNKSDRSQKRHEAAPEPDVIPNDALFSKYQWNLPITDTLRGWNVNKGNQDITVAVIDTGVDLDHEDLKGQLVEGFNAIDSAGKPADDVGHGTHVAGIIGAQVNNGLGVAGMTWYNKIMPVKVLDNSGVGSTYAVAQGIIWATDHGAKVINMSLGNYASSDFLHEAIKYAYNKDVVLIAASGNDNTERPGYPAAYPEVFAVGATDSGNKRAPFSNYGDYIDAAAPGVSIASTYPSNQYAALSGTSMACPHVTALAALLRSANPSLKNTEIMDIMRQTAQDLGSEGRDNDFGYGLIDVERAIQSATGKGPVQAGSPSAVPVPAVR